MMKQRLRNIFFAAAMGLVLANGPVMASPPVGAVCHGPVIDRGVASWYGPGFHGRKTANGEIFNMNAMTAAHKTLKLGTLVEVQNQKTGESVVVRINDRGPYVGNRKIDLSRMAAVTLGFEDQGVAKVAIRVCQK